MIEIHSGPRPSQKRHVMEWFLQLFSYIRLHKLGMGLWNQVPLCCWIHISKTSLVDIQLAHVPTGLSCSSAHLSRLWGSGLYLGSLCALLADISPTLPEVVSGNIKQDWCGVSVHPKSPAQASQPFQSLVCCTQGTTVHIPLHCDPL